MAIDWLAVNQALSPIKGYEDLRRRFQTSFRYPFVGEIFTSPCLTWPRTQPGCWAAIHVAGTAEPCPVC